MLFFGAAALPQQRHCRLAGFQRATQSLYRVVRQRHKTNTGIVIHDAHLRAGPEAVFFAQRRGDHDRAFSRNFQQGHRNFSALK
jgi:hypothetical protein